jgi:hypothetical protein
LLYRHGMRSLAIAAIASGSLLVPRAADSGDLAKVATTAHAVYFAAHARDVDVRRSEAFMERLDALFGPPPAGWRVQYYRHASASELQARFGAPATGVTDLRTGRVDSVRPYHPHELVHAATGRVGLPPMFFVEGLAVALTSEGRWRGSEIDSIAAEFLAARGDLRDVLLHFALEQADRDYALAGSFVAFLLDRYGIEPLVAFVRACDEAPGASGRALRSSYGKSFGALAAEWQSALKPRGPRPRREWYDAASWPRSLHVQAPPLVAAATSGAEFIGSSPLPAALALEAEPASQDR